MQIETRGVDIKIGWKAKQELIRSIQAKQGMIRCFQTGKKYCEQRDCRWRSDCKPGGMGA
jgi:hypothetical protein